MEHPSLTWPAVALLAHDRMKQELLALAREHAPTLGHFHLVATRDTGHLLARHTGLPMALLGHGPFGGDLEVAALVVTGQVAAVVFLRDPVAPKPDEPPLDAVQRACDLHNVPLATNPATARAVLARLRERVTNGLHALSQGA